ncbi:MAG: TatD family hydrolase, partial [Duncaniella sp.]|nr:TatD family hydrolase [Duncaniella sp.]
MMIDTHTHLYLDEFSSDCDEVMHRAIESGVERMIFPNVDLSTVGPMLELHSRYSENTFVAMGLHPTEVKETWRDDLAKIESLFDNSSARYVAVGEIGIDLYWDKTFRDEQMKVFARQV